MIYLTLFSEFLKIGLFAIGGGLVTIPFLFELQEKYHWLSEERLTDIIGMSHSLPGAIGVNMASFVGYDAAGIPGVLTAGVSLVIPPIVIVLLFAGFLKKYNQHPLFQAVLSGIRPASIAMILLASLSVAKVSIVDMRTLFLCLFFFIAMFFYKKSPVFYILLGAAAGIILGL